MLADRFFSSANLYLGVSPATCCRVSALLSVIGFDVKQPASCVKIQAEIKPDIAKSN